jgi:two-component sensor histidine kinase
LNKRLEMSAWRRDGSEFPVELTITHTVLEDGRPFFTGYLRDITERRAASERQRLLAAELDHRVKNTLATVLAIADQTAASISSLADFVPAFNGRVASISRLHDRLSKSHWRGAQLREIVELALAPYADSQGRRVVLSGPAVVVPAKGCTCLCITLHELATNAAKYGSLSMPGGIVEVDWRTGALRELGGAYGVSLEWMERGGPAVSEPTRRGFGTRLITDGIPYELQGTVDLRYDPAGVSCRMIWATEPAPGADAIGQKEAAT